MRKLLRVGFIAKRHISLFVFSFLSLLLLTIANQGEVVAFGLAANRGVDFFALFEEKQDLGVSKADIEKTWDKIDKEKAGIITRENAQDFLKKNKKASYVDRLLAGFNQYFAKKSLGQLVSILVVMTLLKAVALFVSRYATQIFALRTCRDLRERYFAHLQSLPLSFYQRHHIGELTERVGVDSHQIALSINSWMTNYLNTPFTILTSLSFCFALSWKLSCVIFFILPLIVFPVIILTRKVRSMTRLILKDKERFSSFVVDFLSGIKTVKVFSMEEFSMRKYQEQNEHIAKMEIKAAKYDLLTRPILHMVTTLCLVIVLLFGLYVLGMTMAELLTFCGMLRLVYEPVKKFAEENVAIQRGVAAADRMVEVLSIKPELDDVDGALSLQEFREELAFEHVWFRYNDEWALKDISFRVKKGETVAIIGSTGCGKSTLLQLLPRLWDVQIGQILIDGKDLRSYTQSSLREKIAYVSQRPFFFYDSLAENIAHGKEIPIAEIIEAAQLAHAHDFISQLPSGYDTKMLDFGQNFSGGQQQRIAIARALVKKAPILLLDEATSALDSVSEDIVKRAIMELHGKVTQIIVAHRLSTIEHADRILFLEEGSLVAQGTIPELYEKCLPFRKMWDLYNFRAEPLDQTAAATSFAPQS